MQKVFCFFTFMCTFSLSTWTQTIPTIPVTSGITCIARDFNNNIWVGTNGQGLWKFNGTSWAACPTLVSQGSFTGSINFNAMKISDIAVDPSGGVWLANSGDVTSGAASTSGGVDYLPNGFSTLYHYNELLGAGSLPSRYVTTIDVDRNGTVWAGCGLTYYSTYRAGGLAYKATGNSGFTDISSTLPQGGYYTGGSGDSRQVLSLSCGANEIWVGRDASAYTGNPYVSPQIVKYDSVGNKKFSYNYNNTPILPFGRYIVPSAVFVDAKGNRWCGVHNYYSLGVGGICVKDSNDIWSYHQYKLSGTSATDDISIFPPLANVNDNAIWGDATGRVFIGTDKGLVVYNGVGNVGNRHSYALYTVAENCLTSNNILGGVDGADGFQWIATPTGIMHIKIAAFPTKPINYQSCSNATINNIETSMANYVENRSDYHYYKVSTEICDQQLTGTTRCNQTYIYNLMKSKAVYATPTPSAFFGSALPPSDGDGLWKMPFATEIALENAQKVTNPTSIIACAEYSLYNNTLLSMGRAPLYLITAIPQMWNSDACSNVLRNVILDKVTVFPDNIQKTITNYTMPGHTLYPGKVTRYVIEECGKVKVVTIGIGLNNCGDNWLGSALGISNVGFGSGAFKRIDLKLKAGFDAGE